VDVVASLSQGRTAAAQCGLFTYKSVPVIFEPPCRREVQESSLMLVGVCTAFNTSVLFRPVRESGLITAARTTYLSVLVKTVRRY